MNLVDQKNDTQEAVSATLHTTRDSWQGLFFYAVAALAIALIVRFFIAAPYIVSGASMSPTFESWHYLIVDRISYELGNPERGEVVIFRFPQDPSLSFIKRIIGLPGETVILEGTRVTIKNTDFPEGFLLDEPYVTETNALPSRMTVTLGNDEYFVMGDNRRASADSRVWGALPREFMTGRAWARLFPVSLIGLLPGNTHYDNSTITPVETTQ